MDRQTFEYDRLFGGFVQPVPSKGIILTGGGIYVRGQVLALVSVENSIETMTAVDSTAAGTLAKPYAVLGDVIVDTTAGDAPAAAYFAGEFAADGLVFKGTDTVDMFVTAMREKGMIVKTTI
ncbi:hypothetical protein B9G55_01410 [Saccharibacillus sp. O16]|nr:hypothetical protein B9G55_01410 [Saccharibacillus sp. O16]